jgi:hypothetical protein
MTQIPNFQRYNKGDTPDAPEWFHKVMDTINLQIEALTTALQGNVSLSENANCETREITMKQDEEVEISLKKLHGKPTAAAVTYSSIYDFPSLAWRVIDEKKVAVKVHWATGTSTTEGTVKIRLEA